MDPATPGLDMTSYVSLTFVALIVIETVRARDRHLQELSGGFK